MKRVSDAHVHRSSLGGGPTPIDQASHPDLDNIIEKYKHNIREQTSKMRELKRTMQEYDSSLRYVASASEAKLTRKHAEVQDEKDKYIQTLQEELKELRLNSTEAELREEMKVAQGKIKELTEMNARLQDQLRSSRQEVHLLRRQQSELSVPDQSTPLPSPWVRDLQVMSRDLSTLVHLTRSLSSGAELDLRFLLGGNTEVPSQEDERTLLLNMRKHMTEVRSQVSDLYAQFCGSKCASQ